MDKTVSRPGGLFKETVNIVLLMLLLINTLFYNQQNNLS